MLAQNLAGVILSSVSSSTVLPRHLKRSRSPEYLLFFKFLPINYVRPKPKNYVC